MNITNTASLQQADHGFQANLYESANPTRRWLHNVRRTWLLERIAQCSPRAGGRFLEIGIGCGIYTRDLASRGTVTAVDINEEFVRIAGAIPNVTAVVADVQSQVFPAEFDLAICSEVIEHIPESAQAIANLYQALKPGGYLLLTTPNKWSTVELTARLLTSPRIARLAQRLYGEPVDDLGHINRLTRAQLREQITQAGFLIVEQRSLGFYLPGVGEFGGQAGLRLCQGTASLLRAIGLSWLLWTQCWVLRKPAA